MTENNDKTVVKPASDATVIKPRGISQNGMPADNSDPTRIQQRTVSPVNAADSQGISKGSVINNRFVVEETLGGGGMGIVYRALDKRKQEAADQHPYVAIKILGREFQNHPQAFIALQRETRKSQTLAHPNIITVYDFDRDGDTVFMTMEELKGQTLESYIKAHPQGVAAKTASHIIRSMAQGLAYAHSKGIVHSDLKPGNVFITDDNVIKLLDFGIARAVSSINDDDVFDAGDLGGLTPSYASYEMFEGEEAHTSDDIYALGLISYELLTGSHPYYRKPAKLAIQENLHANRIKSIKGNKAKVLLAAVSLKRRDRIEDAPQFLAKFDKTPNSVKALVFAAIVTAGVLGALAILQPPADGPEIAFEELPLESQQRISQLVADGYREMDFGDPNSALFLFNQAYELHPRNFDVVAGLDTVVDSILATTLQGTDTEINQARLQQVNSLLEYPSLAENAELLELRGSLQ